MSGTKRILVAMIEGLLAVLTPALTTCLAGAPPFHPDTNGLRAVEPPIGRLGYRIGTYLTIEGTRAEEGKVGVRTLRVEKVNDYKLPTPISLWIENVDLPKAEPCILKGYETGCWIGVPPQVLEATGERGPQALWQFHFTFIAVSIEQPKHVKINEPPNPPNPIQAQRSQTQPQATNQTPAAHSSRRK
jgi:hypothetical protein